MSPELRATFDTVAELYDRARPSYPDGVIDDVIAMSGVPEGGRVLEIGCGTGVATLPMAKRGYRITAVELGANLAAVARRNLEPYPEVTIDTAAFEEWEAHGGPYDLVFAATAFHWLDRAVAVPKVASLLRPGGAVGIIGGGHVAGGDTAFFDDVQPCYTRWMGDTTAEGTRLKAAAEVPPVGTEIEASGLFGPIEYRRHVWLRRFTTATYLDELNTYSGHIALPDADRAALLACIAERLDRDYGGAITKAYLSEVAVAHRL